GTRAVGAATDLVDSALASADLGGTVERTLPGAAPLPPVPTHFDRAAGASLDDLIAIGRGLLERLTRDGCQVSVGIGRDVSETRVANTAGRPASHRPAPRGGRGERLGLSRGRRAMEGRRRGWAARPRPCWTRRPRC